MAEALVSGKAPLLSADPGEGALARRSLSALAWNLAGGGGKVILQLIIQIALARMLGPAAFGQYSAVLIVLGIGWLLADGGFGSALIQKERIEDDDVRLALGWILLLSLVMALAVAAAAPAIAGQFGDPLLTDMFRAVGVLIFLQGLSNISTSLLRRDLEMKRVQIIHLASYLVGFGVVAIALAALGMGAWSLVVGFGVQTAITLVASAAAVRHSWRPRWRGDGKLGRYGFKVVLTNIANWAIENLDRFMVGRFWGVGGLGYYAVAFNLSRAPVGVLITSLQSVAFSSASRVQHDDEATRQGFVATLSVLALVMFPAFALVGVEAGAVMDLVYGDQWAAAAPLLAAFAAATPAYALGALTGPLLWARDSVEKEFYSQVAIAAALLGGFFLLRHLPLAEAVWLVPAIYLLRFIMLFVALDRLLTVGWGRLAAAVVPGVALAAVAVGTDWAARLLAGEGRGGLLIAALMAVAASLTLLAAFGARLICPELAAGLCSRSIESGKARALCRFLRLSATRP